MNKKSSLTIKVLIWTLLIFYAGSYIFMLIADQPLFMEVSHIIFMEICYLVLVMALYLAYLVAGCVVLNLIDYRLAEWVYNAPSRFLFVIAWTFWPIAILAYYAQSRNDQETS